MDVLAIDIGGTNVKILATGQKERRQFPSGPKLTPRLMVAGVKKLAGDLNRAKPVKRSGFAVSEP